MKTLPVFWRKYGSLFVAVLISSFLAYHFGFRDGYRRASEEVARQTQALLMENCQNFNITLEGLGKAERMDCSLFSDLNQSSMESL